MIRLPRDFLHPDEAELFGGFTPEGVVKMIQNARADIRACIGPDAVTRLEKEGVHVSNRFEVLFMVGNFKNLNDASKGLRHPDDTFEMEQYVARLKKAGLSIGRNQEDEFGYRMHPAESFPVQAFGFSSPERGEKKSLKGRRLEIFRRR